MKLDVRVALDCLPNPSYVTAKKLEEWNYEVPKGAKEVVIPEIQLSTAQLPGAKAAKGGTDTTVKLTNVRLTIITAPGSSDNTVHTGDLTLSFTTLFGPNERAMEPRLSFGDKFLEWTWPVTGVKKLGTSDQTVPIDSSSREAIKHIAHAQFIEYDGAPHGVLVTHKAEVLRDLLAIHDRLERGA